MNGKIKVLILDDERCHQKTAEKAIKEDEKFCAIAPDVIMICKSAEKGDLVKFVDSLMEKYNPHIVLTDIQYGRDEMAGFDISSNISKKYPSVKVVGMTSSAYAYSNEVKASGMMALLNKIYKFEENLISTLNMCLEK